MNTEISLSRRKVLKAGGGLGVLTMFGLVGLLHSRTALAELDRGAFSSKSVDDAFAALGVAAPESSAEAIRLTVPEIAENGAVVPVTVVCTLPNVEQIFILVDKNPNVLAASFTIPEGTEALITTRVKMGQTANVVALVKADGKFYRTAREVKVTAGGCGG